MIYKNRLSVYIFMRLIILLIISIWVVYMFLSQPKPVVEPILPTETRVQKPTQTPTALHTDTPTATATATSPPTATYTATATSEPEDTITVVPDTPTVTPTPTEIVSFSEHIKSILICFYSSDKCKVRVGLP